MKMAKIITLVVEGEWQTVEEAEEDLRNMDDAELWAIAENIYSDYELIE